MTFMLIAVLALSPLPLCADVSYIYARGGKDSFVTAGNVDVERIGHITRRHGGTFLWVEVDDEEHVIRDEATLAEIEPSSSRCTSSHPNSMRCTRA